MIVAGGSYLEICEIPRWRRLFGSGGRAAAAVGQLSPGSSLHTYAFAGWARDVESSMHACGVTATVMPIAEEISFGYFHALSPATLRPGVPTRHPALSVDGRVVLRFSFVEGDAVVSAERAVHDPQGDDVVPFRANGSRAEALAVVLNEGEAEGATGEEGPAAGEAVLALHAADVVVVKRGCSGATVHRPGRDPVAVPAYRSARVFKIGSGDVFSAAFAHHWGERGLDAAAAADLASRAVHHFVDTRSLPLPAAADLADQALAPVGGEPGRVYLAAPFFHIAQRWLVEEARDRLHALGASVFSPLHDVGTGGGAVALATADLAGLDGCQAVLALLDGADPGSIFEVGHARARGIPVVVLAERLDEHHLTMLAGTGCEVVDDFASALYRVVWASLR